MNKYNEIFEKLKKYNQTHLLNFYNELTCDEQEELLSDIENTDFEEITNIFNSNEQDHTFLIEKEDNNSTNYIIEQMETIDKYNLTESEKENYNKLGQELIKNNKVAVCTMAGGQGSRLGHNGPKGTYLVPLTEPKSIFQIDTEKMLETYEKYGVYINWYIMTSEENDKTTKEYFEENNYFGYSKEHIKFFKQGQLPLTDFDGNILLQSKSKIFKAANGNGGIFKALADNGIIEELKNKGIEYLVTCNVDNILIKPIDEIMFGVLKEKNVGIGIKSIIKRSPDEPVGVCCLKNKKPTVIEYIDLPKELAEARNDDGSLKFGEAHFGCNYLNVKLLDKIAEEKLPYHSAKKKNKYIDVNGEFINNNEINSIKSEMFIFDGFEMAEKAIAFRTKREEEFAPIKNKEGNDSPETAVKMYEEYYKTKK